MKGLCLALFLFAIPVASFAQQPPLQQQVYALAAGIQDQISAMRNALLQGMAQHDADQAKIADLTKQIDAMKQPQK